MRRKTRMGLVIFVFGITCLAIDVLSWAIAGESPAEWVVILDVLIPAIGAIIFLWNDEK